LLLCLLCPVVLAVAACQHAAAPGGAGAENWSFPYAINPGVQEGEVTVREGTDVEVRYKRPYESAPRLVIVELRGAKTTETVYSKDEFQIVKQDAKYFRVRNTHVEHSGESWATIKWHAEGVLDSRGPGSGNGDLLAQGDKNSQELLIERIKTVGGKVSIDPNAPKDEDTIRLADRDPKSPSNALDVTLTSTGDPRLSKNAILNIDLHKTAITDADLARLEGLKSLRVLNLYGTKITDAGVQSLSNLTSLQTLYLNGTGVTDAGLQYLQQLKSLNELGLNQTQVTDQGLAYLRGLTGLRSLSLGGTKVTDSGLEQLKGMRSLKRIYLVRTGVTAAGVQELKRSLPNAQISH
jgi:hypothetical protein